MKKILLFLFLIFVSGSFSFLEAQCYGTVTFDDATNANGSNTFTITTAHCNELIMISYDGWQGPGTGPVQVDGNSATHINTAFVYYYAVAETYAYIAPVAGTHTIVCTESPYSSPYFLNSAAAFYVTGSGSPISIASLTSEDATVSCVGGGSVTDTISTSIPGSMIYDNFDCNNGQFGPFIDSWTGGTFMNQLHEGDGIDQSEAYTVASTPGTYTVTADCSASPFPCGGLALLLVAIPPPLCTGSDTLNAVATQINPTCGYCNGSIDITLNGGAPPYTFTWSPNIGSTGNVANLCAGTYTCIVQDASCPTLDSTIVITLPSNRLSLTGSIIQNEACNGECIGAARGVITGGTPPYTYSWTPSGGSRDTATALCAGSYTLTAKDINGCSASVRVTITQPAVLAANVTVSNALCNGGGGSATATSSGGTTPYTYLWTPTLQTTATATGLVAGVYTVTITDKNGCTVSKTATITQPTQVTATMGIPNNILCNGGTGSVTVTPGGGISPYTYLWAPSGGTTATGTGLTAGVYTVTIKDHNGCTGTATATITQPAAIVITTSFTHSSCGLPNGTATASVAGGVTPYTYLWAGNGQTAATATGLNLGTYTVNVTDNNHCTASASVTVTETPAVTAVISSTTNESCYNGNNGSATVTPGGGTTPYTYLWTPGGATTAIAGNLFALGYTVTVSDANGCTVTASTSITQPTAITASVSEPSFICKDSTGIIVASTSGGTPPYSYAWSAGITSTTNTATITPVATRDYSVTVTDHNGCTTTAQIELQYGPNLAVSVKGKTSVCAGDSTTLCAFASGGIGTDVYTWQPGNVSGACITVSPTLNTIYTLSVVDQCGATSTVATTVYADPSPSIKISANVYQGCTPLCVQFHNGSTLSQGGIRQYIWTFGNRDSVQAANPIYCYPSSGSYDVTLTVITDSGCSATYSKIGMITVYSRPNASFTYSPQFATIVSPTIQFKDESSDASEIIYHLWNFGDASDSTSSLANPSHTYHDTGSYCANLVVMNEHGCTDTTTNCLVIEPQYNLYIPSAFSPNGDGINDIFQPVGQYIKSFEMYIFDRWGLQVYHSKDINKGWNGTVNGAGSVAQEDTYIYRIIVTDTEGNEHSYMGNVTLLK